MVAAQSPRLILITPPPIDERECELADRNRGINDIQRKAEHTKLYADACRKVGLELGIETLDLWTIFMKHAGWQEGQPLLGSKDVDPSPALQELFIDGASDPTFLHLR